MSKLIGIILLIAVGIIILLAILFIYFCIEVSKLENQDEDDIDDK